MMGKNKFLYLGLIFLIVGLSGLIILSYCLKGSFSHSSKKFDMSKMRTYMMRDYSKSSYSSNGERIYLTGEDEKGNSIYSNMGQMPMMKSFSCVNCHGKDGRGGLVFPTGVKSANITWSKLKSEFNDEKLKAAITQGKDPDGSKLSTYMPRWQISDKDLSDLIAYLKTLK